MDMLRGRVGDVEVQPGGDEGDGDGGAHGPWGQRPLAPSSSLEMVLLWRFISPSRRLPRGGNFVVPFDLGFLGSRIPVIQITSSVFRGFWKHSNSDWAKF